MHTLTLYLRVAVLDDLTQSGLVAATGGKYPTGG